jgi:hypothetical protein
MAAEGGVTFVVAGTPPHALAVSAARVARIALPHEFPGRLLDVASFFAHDADDGERHVLVVSTRGEGVGICVSGHVRVQRVLTTDVLPLPAVIAEPAWLSHLVTLRGVPWMFVLDLARLDAPEGAPCPWETHAETEN